VETVARAFRSAPFVLLNLFWSKEICAAQGCAFFMPKEPFVPEEWDREPDKQEIVEREIISIQAVGVPERKRLGEAVEAAFLAKATMLGFPVLKPWGDSLPYDFGVDGGRRLWRVQVKCATSHRGTRCDARAAGSGELYTLDDIDFLAAYVIKKNLWYVVPADAFVPRATVHFNYGPKSRGMFERYREAWCLLTCLARARGRGDIPKRCRCEEMPVRCVVCPKR
jgi:PD-(D/E)XK nuclease superfamily protein